jgi:hypothetical protein
VSSSQTGRHQDICFQLGSTQGGKEEESGMQRATSELIKLVARLCGAERAPSCARALPLCHACCLRSLWPGRLPCLLGLLLCTTRSVATAPQPHCLFLCVCVMYRDHRAHLSALGPTLVAHWLLARKSPSPQRRAFSVFSTTPSTTPSTQLPHWPKKCHHRISYVLGWADFSVVA